MIVVVAFVILVCGCGPSDPDLRFSQKITGTLLDVDKSNEEVVDEVRALRADYSAKAPWAREVDEVRARILADSAMDKNDQGVALRRTALWLSRGDDCVSRAKLTDQSTLLRLMRQGQDYWQASEIAYSADNTETCAMIKRQQNDVQDAAISLRKTACEQ